MSTTNNQNVGQGNSTVKVEGCNPKELVRDIARDQAAKGDKPKATDSDLKPPNPTPDPKPIVAPDVPETPVPTPST